MAFTLAGRYVGIAFDLSGREQPNASISVHPTRIDVASGTTGSSVILDPAIGSGDAGLPCIDTNVPAGSFVGTVTPGVSFVLSSSATTVAPVLPTGIVTSVAVVLASLVTLYNENDTTKGTTTNPIATDKYGNYNLFVAPGTYGFTVNGFTVVDTVRPDPSDSQPFGGIGAVVVSGTPASGKVPTATSGSAASWQTPVVAVSSVAGHTGAVTLATGDLTDWPATPDALYDHLPATLLQIYVDASGSDTLGLGFSWGSPVKTMAKALTLAGIAPAHYYVGMGNYSQAGIAPVVGSWVEGRGPNLTTFTLSAGANANVFQDSCWGSDFVVGAWSTYSDFSIQGNAANQTATLCPQTLVTATTALSATPTDLPVQSSTGFSSGGGKAWVGINRCTYTGVDATHLLGVVAPSSVSILAEQLVTPVGAQGHGIALQSQFSVIRNVDVHRVIGSSFAFEGSATTAAVSPLIFNCHSFSPGRYGLEGGENAPDGRVVKWDSANGGLGEILIRAEDWNFTGCHPSGVTTGNWDGAYAIAAVQLCASRAQFTDLFVDTPPNGSVRINTLWRNKQVNEINITGKLYQPSFSSSGAGSGVTTYTQAGSAATSVGNEWHLGFFGRILHAFCNGPVSELVGAQNVSTATRLQVLNSLEFSPLGSAVGGQILISTGTFAYTGTTSAISGLSVAALQTDVTLTVLNVTKFDSGGGTVTCFPTGTGNGPVAAGQIAYTGVNSGANQLTGVTGIPAGGLPVGTGIAQHFLTGWSVLSGSLTTVADGTQLQQNNRAFTQASCAFDLTYQAQFNRRSLLYAGNIVNGRWRGLGLSATAGTIGNPNPAMMTTSIAAGSTTAAVAHNLATTPKFLFVTPSNPVAVSATADGTNVTVTLAATQGTATVVNIQAWDTQV
jgi:hypothetical protein